MPDRYGDGEPVVDRSRTAPRAWVARTIRPGEAPALDVPARRWGVFSPAGRLVFAGLTAERARRIAHQMAGIDRLLARVNAAETVARAVRYAATIDGRPYAGVTEREGDHR